MPPRSAPTPTVSATGSRRRAATPAPIRLVAVTKGHPAETVRAALDAGLTDLGENYAQELVAKARCRGRVVRRLESSRGRRDGTSSASSSATRSGRSRRSCGCGSPSTAFASARRSPASSRGAAVLVQVNLTDDPGRGGTKPGLAAGLVEGLRDLGLDVRGLMAVAPPATRRRPRAGFRVVRDLADRLSLAERSIGMSEDLEAAVKEGTTMVRVGSALFGPRPVWPRSTWKTKFPWDEGAREWRRCGVGR